MSKDIATGETPATTNVDKIIIPQNKIDIKYDAYQTFIDAGLIVQRTGNYSKGTKIKGTYRGRVSHKYSDASTGFIMIVPEWLLSIDMDIGIDEKTGKPKQGKESLEALYYDLGYNSDVDDMPIPTTLTQSGGTHTFFRMPTHLVGKVPELKKLQEKYPNLDIYSDYQTVHPIAGTQYKNNNGEVRTYQWATDEKLVINDFPESIAEQVEEVFMLKDHFIGGDKKEYDDLSFAIKENDMPLEEVQELLGKINPNKMGYDTGFLSLCMALYDRFEGNEEGLEILLGWCEGSDKYSGADSNTPNKWNSGHFDPDRITYKHLRYMEAEQHINKVHKKIEKAKDSKTIGKLVSQVAGVKSWIGTTTDNDSTGEVLERFAYKMNARLKELKVADDSIKVIQARTLLKQMRFKLTEETMSEDEKESFKDIKIYDRVGKYTVIIKDERSLEMPVGEVVKYLKNEGIAEEIAKTASGKAINISDIMYEVSYTQKEQVKHEIVHHPYMLGVKPVLRVTVNPVFTLHSEPYDQRIADDFNYNVWGGMLDEYIRTIALTAKFGDKLKMFALIAPSNTGKSTVAKALGALKANRSQILQALSGSRGLSIANSRQLKNSGMLVIDEMDTRIDDPLKELTDEGVSLTMFGGNGEGAMQMTLSAITFTAIHRGMLDTLTDEFDNRVLAFEVDEADTKYPVTKSIVYKDNPDKYKRDSLNYVRQLFIDTIKGDETIEDLVKLQKMHRVKSTVPAIKNRTEEHVREHIEVMSKEEGNKDFIIEDNEIRITANGRKDIEAIIKSQLARSGAEQPEQLREEILENLLKLENRPNKGKYLRGKISGVYHFFYKDLFEKVAGE